MSVFKRKMRNIMFGIVICTHSDLSKGFAHALAMIAGANPNVKTVSLNEGESLEDLVKDLHRVYEELGKTCQGIITAVDLYGATPFNASMMALKDTDYGILTGTNLAVLLDLSMKNNAGTDWKTVLDAVCRQPENGIDVVYPKVVFSGK